MTLRAKQSFVPSSAYRDVGLISMVSAQMGALNRHFYAQIHIPISTSLLWFLAMYDGQSVLCDPSIHS